MDAVKELVNRIVGHEKRLERLEARDHVRPVHPDAIMVTRPEIDQASIAGIGKPTIVTRGGARGYSLPLYAADEEIYFNEHIPHRWNENSNFEVLIRGYLDSAEDVDDDFALQVSWASSPINGVWPDTLTDVEVRTNIGVGHTAQYSMFEVSLLIDYTVPVPDVASHDYFAARLRRIPVGGGHVEMSGEFVVVNITIHYHVDKVFGHT